MQKTKTTVKLTECAIMVAMAFILSFITIIKMPFGGSVTAASMLPIIIVSYRHGLRWGLISGFAYSLLQLLTGLESLNYATTSWAVISIVVLDFLVAFTVLGLVGIFKRSKHQMLVLTVGTLIVCFLRFVCHVVTGCTVWAGVSIPSTDGVIYSLVYNASYMIPETVVTIYVAALISNSLDLRLDRPVTKEKSKNLSAILNGVLIFGISIVIDFLYLFKQIQSKSGFDVTLIKNTNWGIVGIITLAGVLLGAATYFIMKKVREGKSKA